MCGIIGYSGKADAAPVLLEGLARLEYRGYDSAGIAVLNGGAFSVVKRKGRVDALAEARSLPGHLGIGHTRWATHGAPCERNAHPHVYRNICIVHNGIVENARALRAECEARGEAFASETDSEVIAHLVAFSYGQRGDLLAAVHAACQKLRGSWAIAVMCSDLPARIVCAHMRSPLIVATGEGECLIASDVPAVAAPGRLVYVQEDGEYAQVDGGRVAFYDAALRPVSKRPVACDPHTDLPQKGGFTHFMAKEMSEVPQALLHSAIGEDDRQYLQLFKVLCQTQYIYIVACGTAYHSGLCAKLAFEEFARIPTEVCFASEFRYRTPIFPKNSLVIAVSQSGETADTLAAASLAKACGIRVLAVVNVPHASLTRLADHCVYTDAGREVAVAATKSFQAQLASLYSLAALAAKARGRQAPSLAGLPALARETLAVSQAVRAWTPYFVGARSVFFVGRGADYCAALEGSLKFKEITYLPSEGYPAGELKHGTLALVDASTPVVVVLTCRRLAEKTLNAVHEVSARGANVFLVTNFSCDTGGNVRAGVLLPRCEEAYSPALSVIPLQALAYYVALACGNDPDKPRNLAKSVTVE